MYQRCALKVCIKLWVCRVVHEWNLLAVRGLWAFGPELQVCLKGPPYEACSSLCKVLVCLVSYTWDLRAVQGQGRSCITYTCKPFHRKKILTPCLPAAGPRRAAGRPLAVGRDHSRTPCTRGYYTAVNTQPCSPVQGPNALLDDSLAGETDKGLLAAVRDSVIQVRIRRHVACVLMLRVY